MGRWPQIQQGGRSVSASYLCVLKLPRGSQEARRWDASDTKEGRGQKWSRKQGLVRKSVRSQVDSLGPLSVYSV